MPKKRDVTPARVSGTIYGSDEPLQLVLIQLEPGDAAEQEWPVRQKSFGHACLATGWTDRDGSYQLEYHSPTGSSLQLIGHGRVVLQAFAGSSLKWQSPELPWDGNLDIGGVIEPPIPPRTYTVQGHITTCGEAAEGYVVSAYAVTRIGHPQSGNTCLMGQANTQLIGTSPLDSDGHYVISYLAPKAPAGACGFEASIFVDLRRALGPSDFTSDVVKLRSSITFDHDLLNGCVAGSTLIKVVDTIDRSIAGAEVVSAQQVLGTTNSAGYLAVQGLVDGQEIAARRMLLESETSRQDHGADSNQNWNFRCYQTTVTLTHDEQGDAVSLQSHPIDINSPVQILRISSQNALVGFNLRVSVEWDASTEELMTYRDRFLETSELLYNATEGQFCIERLSVVGNARHWDSADVRVYASIQQSSYATPRGVRGSSGRITMNPIDTNFPGTLLHELGHYLFGLRDEYKAGSNWDSSNGSPRCTLASGDGTSVFSDGGSKHACVMNGHRGAAPKKFCSAHPDNPHVDGTEQGGTDCWTVILEQYGPAGIGLTSPAPWGPRGPVQRQAIVDRLPDSGIPLGTTLSAPGARIPGSFIPFKAWKPVWHIGAGIQVDSRCPGFVVRVNKDGQPLGGVAILLLTADGRTIFEGFTRTAGASPLQDGTPSVEGQLMIRGAHVGDQVQAGLYGQQTGMNTATIVDCAAGLDIELPSLSFFAMALDARFSEANELVVETVDATSPPILRVGIDDTEMPALIRLTPQEEKFEATIYTGPNEQALVLDALFTGADGCIFNVRESISLSEASPWVETTLRSTDGQLKFVLPENSAPAVGRIGVRQVHQPGPDLADWQLTAGPFHLFATFGDSLCQSARMQLRPGGMVAESEQKDAYLIARLDDVGNAWEMVESTGFHPSPLVISAPTSQLGTYALFTKVNSATDECTGSGSRRGKR